MPDNLKGLEVFVAVVESGSFTAAAKHLHLTVSAVSKAVGRLEIRLNKKLFERTNRCLEITEAGTAYYETCVRVMTELAEAEAMLQAQGAEPVGALRLHVPVAFGRMRVMPIILRLASTHSALRPQVAFNDKMLDLVEEKADVAVRLLSVNQAREGFSSLYLGTENLVLCAAPTFAKRHGRPTDRFDLSRFDCVTYGRSDGTVAPWQFDIGRDGTERRDISSSLVLGSAEAQVEAVKAGLGISQLASWLIEKELQSGELVDLAPDMSASGLKLHLVWPKQRETSAKVSMTLDALSKYLKVS
ncbi:LysR family transcriptional regulator [Gluconobacter kanchanaburiensis]|nr:LysR family transcriptional regulator [Gluconobacter kanchanaburiensis]